MDDIVTVNVDRDDLIKLLMVTAHLVTLVPPDANRAEVEALVRKLAKHMPTYH